MAEAAEADHSNLERVTKPSQEPQATPEARCAAVNVRLADDTLGTQFSRNLNLAECLRWIDAQ